MHAHAEVIREQRQDGPDDDDRERERDRAADALRRADRVPEAGVRLARGQVQVQGGREDHQDQGRHLFGCEGGRRFVRRYALHTDRTPPREGPPRVPGT